MIIFWTILEIAKKNFLFFITKKISQFFFFLKVLIRAKLTFADFFSHTWFGGFSNKYLNYEYLGIVFSLVQEKVDLKTLIFWYNITIHHYKKKYFSSFLAKNQKTGRDQIYFFDFFTSGDMYRSNSKQIFGVPCRVPWRLILGPVL